MNPSRAFDPDLHEPGSNAARGLCSHHEQNSADRETCAVEAVVSFQDAHGQWQAGCSLALEQLVEHDEIEPLGQGA